MDEQERAEETFGTEESIVDHLVRDLGPRLRAVIRIDPWGRSRFITRHAPDPLVLVADPILSSAEIRELARRHTTEHGRARPELVGFPAELGEVNPGPVSLEVNRSGRVVHGDPDLLASFPTMPEDEVGLEEALVLLRRRLDLMLVGIRDADFLEGTNDRRAQAIAEQAALVVVAAADALLIESRSYRMQPEDRLREFRRLFGRWNTLVGVVAAAYHIVREGAPDDVDGVRLWLCARRILMMTLFRVHSRIHEVPFADWWDLGRYETRPVSRALQGLFWRLVSSSRHREHQRTQRARRAEIARYFLILSRDRRDGLNMGFFEGARAQLSAITGQSAPRHWDLLTRVVLSL